MRPQDGNGGSTYHFFLLPLMLVADVYHRRSGRGGERATCPTFHFIASLFFFLFFYFWR